MLPKKSVFAWLWVALCILAIYLVVPLARTIQGFVAAHWGRALFGYVVLAATAAAFCVIISILVFRLKIRSPSNYAWLAAVAGLYVYFTLQLWRAPEEAVHFLEYGLLGFFLFRALSLSIRDKSLYATAFLIGSLVGIIDEILQWAMPGRYWDFRDAGLNALATGLFQIALWKGIKPKIISERTTPRSVRRISLLLAVNILLLGLCASNTPQRVAAYASRVPRLSFLVKEEPMYEFTRKHTDPEIGVFFSRLSLEGLEREDSESSDHWANILREWKERDYASFLREHHPLLHPFLYEMRIHIFRRDRKVDEAAKAEDEKSRREALFIAAKENRILEKYFGRTLKQSTYGWVPDRAEKIAVSVDLTKPYRSPVSAGPFQIKEKTLWLGIVVILLVLAAANFMFARSRKQDHEGGRNL
ncbi:MAG: VanZ family protein [Candidatus Aminicenantales bacterium]